MNDDNDDRRLHALIFLWAIITTMFFVVMTTFGSCCPCRDFVAPAPEVHYVHDTVKTIEKRDSIIYQDKLVKDSTSFRQSGDTIRIERWHWERDYRYEKILQAKIDSLSQIKRDSIPYPVPGPVEYIPAQMTNMQIFYMTLGKVFLFILFLALIVILVKRRFFGIFKS